MEIIFLTTFGRFAWLSNKYCFISCPVEGNASCCMWQIICVTRCAICHMCINTELMNKSNSCVTSLAKQQSNDIKEMNRWNIPRLKKHFFQSFPRKIWQKCGNTMQYTTSIIKLVNEKWITEYCWIMQSKLIGVSDNWAKKKLHKYSWFCDHQKLWFASQKRYYSICQLSINAK